MNSASQAHCSTTRGFGRQDQPPSAFGGRRGLSVQCCVVLAVHHAEPRVQLGEDLKPNASDLDLLGEFAPMESFDGSQCLLRLNEFLTLLNRKIDPVMVRAIRNPYITRDIERAKQLLHAIRQNATTRLRH